MKRGVQSELLFDDGDEHVDGDGDPHLGLHGVLRGAVEALDAQVLLDPLEEELDLPAALVERADGQGGQQAMVCQEHQVLVGLRIAVPDAAQMRWIGLLGVEAVEGDGLLAAAWSCTRYGSDVYQWAR